MRITNTKLLRRRRRRHSYLQKSHNTAQSIRVEKNNRIESRMKSGRRRRRRHFRQVLNLKHVMSRREGARHLFGFSFLR